jgi:hypothetical protein
MVTAVTCLANVSPNIGCCRGNKTSLGQEHHGGAEEDVFWQTRRVRTLVPVKVTGTPIENREYLLYTGISPGESDAPNYSIC